ncbi:MAG: cobalt ECF transporter T component CbiQ [Candidatus Aminicenantes bacterium]|nr:cobalt ECF transporter T component CbiQ [Candidatus Aminicenantes bacterium]
MKHSYIDKYGDLNSLLHKLDPRAKVLAFGAALVFMISEPRGEVGVFVFYYVLIAAVALLSRIPLVYILKRCLMAAPFILAAAVLLPLSRLSPNVGKTGLFTRENLCLSLSLLLKAFGAVILLTLLVSSGKFNNLLRGLRRLHMPSLLGSMFALMYRYIFLLNDEMLKLKLARESRTPGKLRISRFKVYGNQAAMIFLRSWKRAQVVYHSMLARGYHGEFPEYGRLRFVWSDGFFLAGFPAVFAVIRIWC